MRSDISEPLNLGSDRLISINDLAGLALSFEDKALALNHVPGPLGVRGRNSDNRLIRERLGWEPSIPLEVGLRETYFWIKGEIEQAREIGESVETASQIPKVAEMVAS